MTISLSQMKPGQIAQIVSINTDNKFRLLKLSGFGLVPGSFVKLEQRTPVYIVRIDETLLSLDGDVAQDIQLQPKQ